MDFDAVISAIDDLRLPKDKPALVVHIYPDALDFFLGRGPKIFQSLLSKARKFGYSTYLIHAGDASLDLVEPSKIHYHIAQLDRPMHKENLIFVMPGYLQDFWYVDPKGVRNHSSLRGMVFDPDLVDELEAGLFFERIREKYVEKNLSKWPQAARGSELIKPNNVTLILQAEKIFPYEKRYLNAKELIHAVLETRGQRAVYIKPHPKAPLAEQEALLQYHDPENGVEISVASVHDLLAQADYMVAQSSAVAFEANMHKVPAIVAGQVDFKHNAVILHEKAGMKNAIQEALNANFHYERYLYWFLHQNMIETENLDEERLWRRLDALNMPLARDVLKAYSKPLNRDHRV